MPGVEGCRASADEDGVWYELLQPCSGFENFRKVRMQVCPGVERDFRLGMFGVRKLASVAWLAAAGMLGFVKLCHTEFYHL